MIFYYLKSISSYLNPLSTDILSSIHVINLGLEQYIIDDFKVDLGVNYSKTELEPESTFVVNL